MPTWRSFVPLTAAGGLVLVLCVATAIAGWRLGWVELSVVAAGCAVALVVAVPFVVGRIPVGLERTVAPVRVQRGEPAISIFEIREPGRFANRWLSITDHFDGEPIYLDENLGTFDTESALSFTHALDTSRRGRYTIGPAVVAREDPMHLMRREVRHVDVEHLWVHPHHVPIPALPVGFAKDLEGPTSDDSPAGDVAFHALREYRAGDDYRHVHWLSTARTGKTMVRHFVDNRRPELLVLLDDRPDSWTPDRFEIGVEIAASIAVSSLRHGQPAALWTLHGPISSAARAGGRQRTLDAFAEVELREGGDLRRAARRACARERRISAMVLVTGDVASRALAAVAAETRRDAHLIVVRVVPDRLHNTSGVPGARLIEVEGLADFRRAWEGIAR